MINKIPPHILKLSLVIWYNTYRKKFATNGKLKVTVKNIMEVHYETRNCC